MLASYWSLDWADSSGLSFLHFFANFLIGWFRLEVCLFVFLNRTSCTPDYPQILILNTQSSYLTPQAGIKTLRHCLQLPHYLLWEMV